MLVRVEQQMLSYVNAIQFITPPQKQTIKQTNKQQQQYFQETLTYNVMKTYKLSLCHE